MAWVRLFSFSVDFGLGAVGGLEGAAKGAHVFEATLPGYFPDRKGCVCQLMGGVAEAEVYEVAMGSRLEGRPELTDQLRYGEAGRSA